jgi:hypothetical protein
MYFSINSGIGRIELKHQGTILTFVGTIFQTVLMYLFNHSDLAIYTYYEALIDFINEIQTGVFMQFSLENMLQY